MNIRSIKGKFSVLSASLILSLAWAPAIASAEATPGANAPAANTSANSASNAPQANDSNSQATELSKIISRGNLEIERRLTNLNKLSSLITSSDKLTAQEQSFLTNEISSATSSLNSLKTQLDSETTVTAARTDVQSIVSEYRIYALVDPKIHLLKIADDQQVTESKLSAFAQILQARITEAQTAGSNVATLSTDLASLNSLVNAAQTISSQVEADVINLQPSDYNSNHNVLEGYNTQLKTAHMDIESAYSQAKSIVAGLEALKTTSSTSNTTN